MQCDQHERAGRDQEQIVGRQISAEDFHRAAQPGRPRPEHVLRTPDPQRGVIDDQHQRKGRKQLEQLRRAIDPAQQDDFDQGADQSDQDCGCENAAPEPERAANRAGERRRHIGAEHEQRSMRDIDDARDAEDQREPGGDEKQARGGGEPVERLKQKTAEAHRMREANASLPRSRGKDGEGATRGPRLNFSSSNRFASMRLRSDGNASGRRAGLSARPSPAAAS